MRFYVGVNPDYDWFHYLRSFDPPPEDINFWQPSARQPAKLERGEPLFSSGFMLPTQIAGLGFFFYLYSIALGHGMGSIWPAQWCRKPSKSWEKDSSL